MSAVHLLILIIVSKPIAFMAAVHDLRGLICDRQRGLATLSDFCRLPSLCLSRDLKGIHVDSQDCQEGMGPGSCPF